MPYFFSNSLSKGPASVGAIENVEDIAVVVVGELRVGDARHLALEILGRDPQLGPPRSYEENATLFDPAT